MTRRLCEIAGYSSYFIGLVFGIAFNDYARGTFGIAVGAATLYLYDRLEHSE